MLTPSVHAIKIVIHGVKSGSRRYSYCIYQYNVYIQHCI